MEGHLFSYDQNDATGFIRPDALRLKLRAALRGRGDWPQSPGSTEWRVCARLPSV